MKMTKVRISDACECAFHGFALDVQDNCAGLWDGDSSDEDGSYTQDAEATRTALKWAGWLGEDGEVLEGVQFPDHILVPADASAEMIERVAALIREAGDVEGMDAEEDEKSADHRMPSPESAKFARKASDALYRLAGALSGLNIKRHQEAQAQAKQARFAKARRVVWTHYTGSTLIYLVVGWRECGCGAKVAELVEGAERPYVTLRCARTGGWVGAVLNEGDLRGEVLNAKSCDADPDAEWVALLEGVTP